MFTKQQKENAEAAVQSGNYSSDEFLLSLGIDPQERKKRMESAEYKRDMASVLAGQEKIKEIQEQEKVLRENQKKENRKLGAKKAAETRKANKLKGLQGDLSVKTADKLLTPFSAGSTLTDKRVCGQKNNLLTGGVANELMRSSGRKNDQKTGFKPNNDVKKQLLTQNLQKDGLLLLKSLIFGNFSINSRTFSVIPPQKNYVQNIVTAFRDLTDIPLELPLFVSLHFLAAYLLQNGVRLMFKGRSIMTDIWCIILADSGDGKSYTVSRFANAIGLDVMPDGIASSAKFIEEFEQHNNSLWVYDEFAQFLKAIRTQTYMEEMRGYILQTYDNKDIGRRTKTAGDIVISRPALVILGLNAYGSFFKNIDYEYLVDGTAQRFNYVAVEPDLERPSLSVPGYPDSDLEKIIKKEFKHIKKPRKGKNYQVPPDTEKYFNDSFLEIAGSQRENIPASFIRRTLYKSLKYALLYHILLGKAGQTHLDQEDIAWSVRLATLHLADVKKILNEYNFSDLEKVVKQAEELKAKCSAAGKILKTRDMISHIRGIRNIAEANAILSLINAR